MKANYLHDITAKLDGVFKSSEKVDDDEIRSHFAKYLCVLTSGYIEESIRIIIKNYVHNNASTNVRNHFNSLTDNLTNLKIEKIDNYLSSFNPLWKNQFDDLLTDEEKDAINSIIANRHLIAHGRNVGISYVNVKNWFTCSKRVIEKINTIINGE
jgi:hypothetical protein